MLYVTITYSTYIHSDTTQPETTFCIYTSNDTDRPQQNIRLYIPRVSNNNYWRLLCAYLQARFDSDLPYGSPKRYTIVLTSLECDGDATKFMVLFSNEIDRRSWKQQSSCTVLRQLFRTKGVSNDWKLLSKTRLLVS